MPQNCLDLALAHFAPAEETELYTVLKEATAAELQTFLIEYRRFAASAESSIPELLEDELRPFLPYLRRSPLWSLGGVQLDYQTLREEGAEWRVVDAIKHCLFYCHSVALDDPFGHLLLKAADSPDLGRPVLLRYVNLLLHLAPLLRSHVLCLVPPYVYSADPASRRQRRDDFETILGRSRGYDATEFVNAAPMDVRERWGEVDCSDEDDILVKAALDDAARRVATGLETVLHAHPRLSLYLSFRADAQLLRSSRSLAAGASHFSERDGMLLNELTNIEMPGLATLDPHVLVDIRGGPEFAEWRRTLSRALGRRNAERSSWPDSNDGDQEFQDELIKAREKLESTFARSRALSGYLKGRTSFIVGLAGLTASLTASAIVDSTGPPTATIASLIASSLAAAILEASEVKQPSKASRAALAHYVSALT